jgi:hypothetical protein
MLSLRGRRRVQVSEQIPVWFVTNDADSPEGLYIGARARNTARYLGANEFGCDYADSRAHRVKGVGTMQVGIIRGDELKRVIAEDPAQEREEASTGG